MEGERERELYSCCCVQVLVWRTNFDKLDQQELLRGQRKRPVSNHTHGHTHELPPQRSHDAHKVGSLLLKERGRVGGREREREGGREGGCERRRKGRRQGEREKEEGGEVHV